MEEMELLLAAQTKNFELGDIIIAEVVCVRDNEILINIGYKSDFMVTKEELAYPVPETAKGIVQVGEKIRVQVMESGKSETGFRFSKIKADQVLGWELLQKNYQSQIPLTGMIVSQIKGGFLANVEGVQGFIPLSQIDLHRIDDSTIYVGNQYEFLITECDQSSRRLVLSRRLLLDKVKKERESILFTSLDKGIILKGTVSRLTDFGAFIDIGGYDGLVHISDLAWHKVSHPSQILQVGETVEVIVTNIDKMAKRISLSVKALLPDPWLKDVEELQEGMVVTGKISKTANFGAFIQIKNGIDGLIPISELTERKVKHSDEVISVGQEVSAKIILINKEQKRISLSLLQAQQEKERSEYVKYLQENDNASKVTLGDKFAHLFQNGE